MTEIRRSPLARAAPILGATLVLLWLTSSTSAGAPLPWASHLPLELWRSAQPSATLELDSPAPAPVLELPALRTLDLAPAVDPLLGRPYAREIRAVAGRHAIDPLLLAAIVEVESNFEADAVSPKGAVGLMQLMPVHFDATVEPFEPRVNLDLGARFLAALVRRFGDLPTALAAYHAGPGAVERAGGRAPYASTRAYVARVLSIYGRNRAEAGSEAAGATVGIADPATAVASL